MVTKTITSIKSYIETITQLRNESLELELPQSQWFFRGQKDRTWSVEPNIFRNSGLSKESTVIQNALRQNPFDFKECKSDFEILTKLQHYELGTRLLDVTLNPLVALYFATEQATQYKENKNNQYTQIEQDGVIFAQFAEWHTIDELPTRIVAAIPFLDFGEGYTVSDLLSDLEKKNVISPDEGLMLRENKFELFSSYIQSNYFVISSHSNERLIRQSGAFVLPSAITIYGDAENLANNRIAKSHRTMEAEFQDAVLLIPNRCKQTLREELDFFNINEATLFPELEHQMKYIKQKNLPIEGAVPLFKPYVPSNREPVNHSDLTPDESAIVKAVLPDLPESRQNDLISSLCEQTQFVDWKVRASIQGQMRLIIKRALLGSHYEADSNHLAQEIMNRLLDPPKEMSR